MRAEVEMVMELGMCTESLGWKWSNIFGMEDAGCVCCMKNWSITKINISFIWLPNWTVSYACERLLSHLIYLYTHKCGRFWEKMLKILHIRMKTATATANELWRKLRLTLIWGGTTAWRRDRIISKFSKYDYVYQTTINHMIVEKFSFFVWRMQFK